MNLEERFWSKVQKTEACWIWIASKRHGYGQFFLSKKNSKSKIAQAHRFSYELAHGPIQKNLVIDHLCSNPACVRPDHLEATTDSVNCGRGTTTNVAHSRWWRFRNVTWIRRVRLWRVKVGRTYGGYFEHEEVAAMQANVMAARMWSGFRAFNQVEMG